MSYISALENANRVIRPTINTTPTQSGATQIFVTLSGWPSWAYLDRLVITANNAFTALRIRVLSDAAAYRAATGAAQSAMVLNDVSDTVAGTSTRVAMGGNYVEDANHSGNLYLLISQVSNSAFATAGTVFTVTAEGRSAQTNNVVYASRNNEPYDNSWRVLHTTSITTTDMTQSLMRNGNPYGLSGTDQGELFTALAGNISSGEYLYVGSVKPITKFGVLIATASLQTGPITAQYWNGTWNTLPLMDNTSDGQTIASSFSYSGVIEISPPSDWALSQIATDPLTVYVNQVTTGFTTVSLPNGKTMTFQVQPPSMLNSPNRYWLRLGFASLSPSPLNLAALVPIR